MSGGGSIVHEIDVIVPDGVEHAQQLALSVPALKQQDRQAAWLPVNVWPIFVLPDPEWVVHGAIPEEVRRSWTLFGSFNEPTVWSIRLMVQSSHL